MIIRFDIYWDLSEMYTISVLIETFNLSLPSEFASRLLVCFVNHVIKFWQWRKGQCSQ